MAPQTIIADLWAHGILLRLSPDGANLTAPAGSLSDEQRAQVLAHKPQLVEFLRAARQTTADLVEAAMRSCDQYGDGAAAREQMARDCRTTPPHLKANLLDYFQRTYGGKPC